MTSLTFQAPPLAEGIRTKEAAVADTTTNRKFTYARIIILSCYVNQVTDLAYTAKRYDF